MSLNWLNSFSFLIALNFSVSVYANLIRPCEKKPNCVSSKDQRKDFFIEPIDIIGSEEEAKKRLKSIVKGLPRTNIVEESESYIHSEFTSSLFRFVDDVEFLFDMEDQKIHVRSASRTGYGDWGVNRKRVEQIRSLFSSEKKLYRSSREDEAK